MTTLVEYNVLKATEYGFWKKNVHSIGCAQQKCCDDFIRSNLTVLNTLPSAFPSSKSKKTYVYKFFPPGN